jgi:hypothetical protein
MNSPQPLPASNAMILDTDFQSASRWLDDDIALGCECADPALQIDCWQDPAQLKQERY